MPGSGTIFRQAVITISASTTISAAVDVQGYDVVAIQQPADCEGTAWTFQGSVDGINFAEIRDNAGNVLTVTKQAATADCIMLGTKEIRGLKSLKLVAGSAQNADITISVGLRAAIEPGN